MWDHLLPIVCHKLPPKIVAIENTFMMGNHSEFGEHQLLLASGLLFGKAVSIQKESSWWFFYSA